MNLLLKIKLKQEIENMDSIISWLKDFCGGLYELYN